MKRKFVIGLAVYFIFFAAVALSTGGSRARTLDLLILSLGVTPWLVFSLYRIMMWFKNAGRRSRRRPAVISNYPHWFARFALDENGEKNRRKPMGLIDTI